MNDSNPKDKTKTRLVEDYRRRKSGIIKPKSRRQRRRAKEIFFINQGKAYQSEKKAAFRSGCSTEEIKKRYEENMERIKKEIMRFSTLQYLERHLSGPKYHMLRQIKFKVKRSSSPKGQQWEPYAGLALLAGSQPTGAR